MPLVRRRRARSLGSMLRSRRRPSVRGSPKAWRPADTRTAPISIKPPPNAISVGTNPAVLGATLSSAWLSSPRVAVTCDARGKLPRRKFLHLAAGAAAFPTILRTANADTYPSRPVRYIVGYAPGGRNDIVARLMGRWLSERTGQQFVIENRPGAGTNIATEAVVNAPPDGYTLLSAGAPNAINATLYEKLNFNFIRDIAPVAGIVSVANVFTVHPSVSAKTVPEFIAYAKTNPGMINMATNGNGSASHMSAELFKMMTGVNMVNVPYRGTAPAITALLGGQVQGSFVSLPGSIAYIKAGKLRAIAVTTAMRSEALPDIPTVAEFVPGYEASVWYGIGTPTKTPGEIIAQPGLYKPKCFFDILDILNCADQPIILFVLSLLNRLENVKNFT
jgi:tripartite-type tricarboxylate transporter receptor subunit TctC